MNTIYTRKAKGKQGIEITIYKIRTIPPIPNLHRDNLRSLSGLIDTEEAKHISPFSSFLRKSGLDELPQLWNVLVLRNMQFLGVRPIMVEEFELLPKGLQQKLMLEKPGLIPAEAKFDYVVGDLDSRLAAIERYFEENPQGFRRVWHAIEALMKRVLVYSKR